MGLRFGNDGFELRRHSQLAEFQITKTNAVGYNQWPMLAALTCGDVRQRLGLFGVHIYVRLLQVTVTRGFREPLVTSQGEQIAD